MNAKKTYFLVPPGNPQAIGSIVLGDVFTDPTLTNSTTVNQEHLVFPPSIRVTSGVPVKNWKWSKDTGVKGGGGMYANVVAAVDIELSGRREKRRSREYFCRELETQSFQLSDAYMELIKSVPAVQARIKDRESLYVVTGIKIAKGATVNEEAFKSLGFRFATTVDLTALTVAPVKIGPQADGDVSNTERLEYNVEEDFVFAYRLEEIYYSWRRALKHRPYRKDGDLYGVSPGDDAEDGEESDENEDDMDNFVFDERQSQDASAPVMYRSHQGYVVDDDGEEYDVYM